MVKKAKNKGTGEVVEYMVFAPEDIPEIEKWANIEIETTNIKGIYNFKNHGFIYSNTRFSHLVKYNNQVVFFNANHFQENFEKIEPDAFDKVLEEHPETRVQIEKAVADYQQQVKVQKEFSLVPELEQLLRHFEDAQCIILDNDPEKEQMRKNAATDALYNFCRGLVIGAKITKRQG